MNFNINQPIHSSENAQEFTASQNNTTQALGRRGFLKRALFLPALFSVAGGIMVHADDTKPASPRTNTFTLWQLPSQTPSQMMSYVLRSVGGKIVVIDGGMAGDAPYLRGFLAALGNKVEMWFITHPHSDHVDALTELLKNPQGLEIGTVYASLPDEAWRAKNAPTDDAVSVKNFNESMPAAAKPVVDMQPGQSLVVDGIHIQVLGIRNPEFTANPINNSSAVLKVWDRKKSILFLADLGLEAGEKLLYGPFRGKLHADYVQMAHHGQNGVGEDVYRAIAPSYCLWPTPRWLWNNDSGKGKGSGRWKTLEVRAWMDKLNIKAHYVSAGGLCRID